MAKKIKKPSAEDTELEDDATEEVEEVEETKSAAEPSPTPSAEDGEPAKHPPAAGSRILISGSGMLSIMADGKANEVERGVPVEVSAELLEAIKAHGETVEEV